MKSLKLYGNVLLSLIVVTILLISSVGPTNAIIFENNSSMLDISNSSRHGALNNLSPGITNSSLSSQNNSYNLISTDVKNKTLQDISYHESLLYSLPKWQSKLSTDLLLLVNNSFLTPGDDINSHNSKMKRMDQYVSASSFPKNSIVNKPQDDMVLVYIYVSSSTNTSIVDDYAWYVLSRNEKGHYAAAYVEVKNLEKLASLDNVKSIRTVTPPVSNMGSVNPLSDTLLGTNQTRSHYHINGSGISVGIISTGINNYTISQSTGDLPPYPQFSILRYLPWPFWGNGDEGTAMAEIVYDIVPNATIYYGDPGTVGDSLVSSANALVGAGCNIIVDDLTYFDQPWFEDGGVTTGLRNIYQVYPNVTLITAAGNWANQSYQGDYYNDGNNCMDFSRGTSGDKRLHITLPAGATVKIALQWNDKWGNSSNNYDLYLINNQTGANVAWSTNTQTGQGCNPYQFISYPNPNSTDMNYDICVVNRGGLAQTRTLKLILYFDKWYGTPSRLDNNNYGSANSIVEHNGMPEEITVGAINGYTYYNALNNPTIYDPNPLTYLETFSSQGPVTLSYPTPTIIPKPDILGLDAVEISPAALSVAKYNTYHDGAYRFFGTSAAAPGVAGILAQLECAYSNLTRDQYRSMLMASTGCSTQNSTDGYGLVNASRMYPMNSSYVGDTINSIMVPGQQYTVSVTMLNNWTTSWSAANGIELAGLGNSSLFGVSNISMDTSSVVQPGGSYTWTFNVTAPNQTGVYNLGFQLAWAGYAGGSGYATFGDVSNRTVNVVPSSLFGYQYYKSHLINGSIDGALTGYPVKFVVNSGSGTDNGQDVYLNGQSLSWPNDIRFTDSSNNLLSYWIESYNSSLAIVWVNVSDIPASPGMTTVKLYYGKSGAYGASNGAMTFSFFDDFTAGMGNWNTGLSVIENNGHFAYQVWPGYNVPHVTNNVLTMDGTRSGVFADYEDGVWSGWWGRSVISKTSIALDKFQVVARMNYTHSIGGTGSFVANSIGVGKDKDNYVMGGNGFTCNLPITRIDREIGNTMIASDNSLGAASLNTWHIVTFNFTNNGNCNYAIDNLISATLSTGEYLTTKYVTMGFYDPNQNIVVNQQVSYIFIRNWTTNEPTHGVWTG